MSAMRRRDHLNDLTTDRTTPEQVSITCDRSEIGFGPERKKRAANWGFL